MLINPLLKTRKPRQFEYKPRFFDPEKEARENRKREILGPDYQKAYDNSESSSERIHFRRGIIAERQRNAEQRRNRSITRLLIVLALLILFSVWLFS
jgi:hypothetical protein